MFIGQSLIPVLTHSKEDDAPPLHTLEVPVVIVVLYDVQRDVDDIAEEQ